MVLFLIGVCYSAYLVREIIRLWHEPDAVLWLGPVGPETQEPSDSYPLSPGPMSKSSYQEENFSKSGELPNRIAQMTDFAVPAAYEFHIVKLVQNLPKDVREVILEEADTIEKLRLRSNKFADFVQRMDDIVKPKKDEAVAKDPNEFSTPTIGDVSPVPGASGAVPPKN